MRQDQVLGHDWQGHHVAGFMKQEAPCTEEVQPELAALTRTIGSGRYFRRLAPEILHNILAQGTLINVPRDYLLIREGDESPPEIYILVEGSLAIISNGKFILRLDQPGDVVGEMAVIQSVPRSADVLAETPCRLIVFPAELFRIDPGSPQASILYVLFSHLMSAKLRITTAQSLIRKNQRVTAQGEIHIGIIDPSAADRSTVRESIQASWPEANITEFDDPPQFVDHPTTARFDLIVADIDYFEDIQRDWNWVSTFIKTMQLRGAHVIILSRSCGDEANREFLIRMGADDLVAKPCAPFDLNHVIAKVRVWYYKNLELDKAESAADTDLLTGLANRRRLDQFLEALVTVYPEDKKPFSLIMTDVDNFKHYNDAHGHQMGDTVLQGVAALLEKNVRRGDLAARFGGEEFIIVMPDCGKTRALEVAEALRLSVASATFPNQEQQPDGNLTITLGVATFPRDGRDLDALLKRADDCLYEGKRRGKNIVIGAGPA
ncbi:MAG: diguanylate cyclase [Halioglobus sp.]|nr:diguanylate cyclase [Halioglobus sp.]